MQVSRWSEIIYRVVFQPCPTVLSVLVCEHVPVSYHTVCSGGLKVQAELRRKQDGFNYRITTSPYVSNQSVCQPAEHPTSVTLPAETCLGKDASVVCSASIDSDRSIIRVDEVQLCWSIHLPLPFPPPHTGHYEHPEVQTQGVTPHSGRKSGRKIQEEEKLFLLQLFFHHCGHKIQQHQSFCITHLYISLTSPSYNISMFKLYISIYI